jgi:hypothetical protein
MKSRFLDSRNCHALLPMSPGFPVVQRLDECLHKMNDKDPNFLGLIDDLIEHNKKTSSHPDGGNRYIDCKVDIAIALDEANGNIAVRPPRRRGSEGPARLHLFFISASGVAWKIIIPLQFLLKGWGDANAGYQCYVHTITQNMPRAGTSAELQAAMVNKLTDQDQYYYYGITGRNWLQRFSEHMREIRRGSNKKFHTAWRDNWGKNDVLFVSSLMFINMTYEDAMQWEEIAVDRWASDKYGLNMIPGGFKGLRFLHEHRITDRVNIPLEERETAIAEYVRLNPRKGIPNPFIAELWKDDDFYQRNIDAREKTLSVDQVCRIRKLHNSGWSVPQIAKEVDALNEAQVRNVIAGRTYKRVHC